MSAPWKWLKTTLLLCFYYILPFTYQVNKKRASICGKIKVLKLKKHTKEPSMSIVNTLSLESNRKIKINFDGGDLSSNAGLLLIKEFVSKLGIDKLFSQSFKTNDSALFRITLIKKTFFRWYIWSLQAILKMTLQMNLQMILRLKQCLIKVL